MLGRHRDEEVIMFNLLLWFFMGGVAAATFLYIVLRVTGKIIPFHLVVAGMFFLVWPFAVLALFGWMIASFMNFLCDHGEDTLCTRDQFDNAIKSFRRKK